MRKMLEASGVALAGLVTSILTAVLVTAIDHFTGINVFTFSLWVLVPAGAAFCGFAAASGYYLAAKALHQRPRPILLVQMILIAAFTQALIYWLEYATMVVEGVYVSSVVPFSDYMDAIFTKAHLRLGRLPMESTAIGELGYVLAGLEFLGFLIGGAFVYLLLRSQPTCEPCSKYLRTLARKKDGFEDVAGLVAYYDNEFQHPIGSPEFAAHVGEKHSAGKPEYGSVSLVTKVLGCPTCGLQAVSEKVQVFNGREWKEADELNRFVPIPPGHDVAPFYR